MVEITIDATGSAPAGAVWERYMDPSHWSHWATHIAEVEYPENRLSGGTSGRVEGPFWFQVDFDIVSVDELGWTWTWNAWWRRRSIGLTLKHGVASRPDGSRAWITVCGSPALVVPYVPLAKLALVRLVRR